MNELTKQIDGVKSCQEWPYKVWNIFTTTFPTINREEFIEQEVEKYLLVLKSVLENAVNYTSSFYAHNRCSGQQLNEHKAFVVWLFGQFNGVLLRERYSPQFDSCVNTQLSVLNLLIKNNEEIFSSVIQCYIIALKELISTFDSSGAEKHNNSTGVHFENKTFNWFVPEQTSNLKSNIVNLSYKITNKKLCVRMVNHFILVLSKNMTGISYCCQHLHSVLWDIAVQLFKIPSSEGCNVFYYICQLVNFCELPRCHRLRYILLQLIKEQIQHVCNEGKLPDGKDKDFEDMLNAFSLKMSRCYTFNNILSSTSFPRISTSLNTTTESAILKFLENMVSSSSYIDLRNNIDDFELSDLYCYNRIILTVIIDDISNLQSSTNLDDKKCLKVAEISTLWRNIVSKINAILDDALRDDALSTLAFNDIRHVLTPLLFATDLVSDLSHKLLRLYVNHEFHFFEQQQLNRILQDLIKLIKSSQVKLSKILRMFLQIIGNLATLPEISYSSRDDNEQLVAVSFIILGIPWIFSSNMSLHTEVKNDIIPIYNTYRTLIDANIKEICLAYLAHISSDIYCQLRDKYVMEKLLLQYNLLLPILPALICGGLSNQSFICLMEHIILDSNEAVHVQFSKSFKNIICSLSRKCHFKRSSVNDVIWEVECPVCDDNADINCNGSDDALNYLPDELKTPILKYCLKIVKSSVVEAKFNIINNIPFITNHISKTDFSSFFNECTMTLLNYFKNDGMSFGDRFVDVIPYFVFPKHMLVADRKPSSERKLIFGKNDLSTTEQETFNQFINFIFSIATESLNDMGNEQQQYISMKIIFKIGCVPCSITLLPSLKTLTYFLIHASSHYPSCAKFYIQEIALAHGLTEDLVYIQYRDEILKVVINLFILNHLSYGIQIQKSLYKFDYKALFNDSTQNHLLKFLIPYIGKNNQLFTLLSQIAEIAKKSVKQILIDSFRHVYPHVTLFESAEVVQAVLKLITERTNLSLSQLLAKCYTKILVQFLIFYHCQKNKVEEAIISIHNLNNDIEVTTMRECIERKFLGILLLMEHNLTSECTPHSIKCHILSSFSLLISKMNKKYITSVRFKILATLKTMLTIEGEHTTRLSIKAWRSFVHSIQPDVLGPMLSTIFVCLLPFIQEHSNSVNSIFRFLVLDNETAVESYIDELYFVDQPECCKDVYRKIQACALSVMQKPIQKRLELIIKWMKHDISEIKLHGLKRLQMELSKYGSEISHLVLPNSTANYIILEVLTVLINGLRDSDVRVQEASGECLGEIGAIDPSYIPYTVKQSDLYSNFPILKEDTFVMNGLTVLCRGFQAAKTSSVMDNFALAIQEFLNIYSINENSRLWKCMRNDLREIISPFCSTAYVLPMADNADANLQHPIYGSYCSRTLYSWGYHWSSRLSKMLPDNCKLKSITVRCKGAISAHDDCISFFLPHIVLNTVLYSNEDCHVKIFEEMMAVVMMFKINAEKTQTQTLNTKKIYKSDDHQIVSTNGTGNEETAVKANVAFAKMVFSIIELLLKALYEIGNSSKDSVDHESNPEYTKLKKFLDKFDTMLLAKKAVECGEYAKALFYIEDYIKKNESPVESHISILSNIYYHLNDTDDLKGVLSLEIGKPKQPQDIVLLHEITDQFHDAAICYQKLLHTADEQYRLLYQRNMLRCYLAINQPEVTLRFISDSVWNEKNCLHGINAEALWSLSQFENLNDLVNKRHNYVQQQHSDSWNCSSSILLNENFGLQLGSSMIHLLNIDKQSVRREICSIRRTLSKLLHISSISFSDYRESYEQFVKLHILNEFEKVAKLVTAAAADDENTLTLNDWKRKFKSVITTEFQERLLKLQPSSRVLQPVLNMRRVLFVIAQKVLSTRKPELNNFFQEEINKCWIKRIEIARRTRNFQLAYSNILEAQSYEFKGFYIEKAKYYWDKMDYSESLQVLKHGLAHHYPNISIFKNTPIDENISDRQLCSETLLLIGTYNDKMANIDIQLNLQFFKDAVEVYKCSEKVLVKLANYKDKILNKMSREKMFRQDIDEYVSTVDIYGKSLNYGCNYIYQSMPRILSIWLDFSQHYHTDWTNANARSNNSFNMKERQKGLSAMCALIASLAKRLPAYFFFTAFSQITSRMSCSTECFMVLKIIIIRCIMHYPNQALWRFTTFLKSSSEVHVSKCKEILADQSLNSIRHMNDKYRHLFSKLSLLSETNVPRAMNTKLSSLCKDCKPFLQERFYEAVMVPVQKFLDVTLPHCNESYNSSHNPFPQSQVMIYKFKDEVKVYNSLQRPKQIFIIGTDGLEYSLMCKAQDDLRIDSRFMEFSSIVNMYLKRDVEARDRQLYIRTFSVLPLHTKCGIIEFIPNLITLRNTTLVMHSCLGLPYSRSRHGEIVEKFNKKTGEERLNVFLTHLIPSFPPVLHEWYRRQFPNPGSWYTARSAYIRTLAVMSIVGYIMGLGDRHNDNILLDPSNGDIVHVDFNQLFNAGERLMFPEVVPFRLTKNMVIAMGPLGVEGMFIRTCEVTNRVLRNHKEQLISVLNPFLYDPLRWANGNTSVNKAPVYPDDEGRSKILDVELRLDGVVRSYNKGSSVPLSVEGQTRRLIEEATDINNLCSMFGGWGAYM